MFQSTLLSNRQVSGNDRFALQNGKMLKAVLGPQSGMAEFFARKGAMVAYQGAVTFDGHHQGWGAQFARRFTGEGLNLMRVAGNGAVYLANQAQDIHILDLTGDRLTVDGENVLAFENTLRWDIVRIDSHTTIAGAGSYNIELGGTGKAAVTTTGPPLVMRVTPHGYHFADADAVIAWSSDLQVTMQAAVASSSVWRPRGSTGESWQMQFIGDGIVVVQPAELLPPYDALAGTEVAGRFGLGQSGFSGR
jgi:uncharacterized protein (AIM24 family)